MNRRGFLTTLSVAPFIATNMSWAVDAKQKIDRVGMQLYTVRELLKRDFEGTLAKVAQIGYSEVEFAGYFDHSPKDLRAMLDRHGLSAPSAHIPYGVLGDKWPGVLEDAHLLGHGYLVCPWIDDDVRQQPGGWMRAAEKFNRAGEASKKAGIQFAYHNHHFEFVPVGARIAYDVLLDETDPNLVKMEMDLCWITVAGQDPHKYFERYPGRFPLVHVKDVKRVPPREGTTPVAFEKVFPELTTVGAGSIDWKRIFGDARKAGIEYYFVENDEPQDPFDFLQGSYKYLRDLRF